MAKLEINAGLKDVLAITVKELFKSATVFQNYCKINVVKLYNV